MFLTARQNGEAILRRIGAYSINDSGPRPQDMEAALRVIESLIAELSGVVECFWLLTSTVSLPLTSGTVSYNLKTALGTDWPGQGIEYVREAWLEDSSGNRSPLEIVTRHKFESQTDPAKVGRPEMIHVDRVVPIPTLRPWPIPDDASWTVKMVIQALAPQVQGVGPIPKTNAGEALSAGLPSSWNRWLEYAGAADAGSGPVRKLPDATTNTWRLIGEQSKERLLAFQNREHDTTPPITGSMDLLCGGPTDYTPRHRYYTDGGW